MNRCWRAIAVAMLMGCLANSAWAQPGRPRGGASRLLQALDRDGDGELSEDEISAAVRSLRALDRNQDGELSGAEVSSSASPSRPGSSGSQRMARAGLKVGGPLPNVTVFDARGRKTPLGQLKGDYTVLVFGCLT